MNTQNNPAQTEQPQAPKLTPDFSHRLCASDRNQSTLTDSICLMTERALGVLQLISMQFYDEDGDRLSDVLMCGAIDAAIKEINDIKALTKAYCLAESAKKRA